MKIKTLSEARPGMDFFAVIGAGAQTVVVVDLLAIQDAGGPVAGLLKSNEIRVVDFKFGSAPGGRCLRLVREATADEPICGVEFTDAPQYLFTTRKEAEAAAKELANGLH
jgi:hypothetical protein